MKRRILVSLMIIGFVGAGLGGTTMAMFNDSETSNNNQFTAGELDLRIDWEESYNGEDVETQELTNDPGAIFNLQDMKPGDHGEATISLHLQDNPGWVWMNLDQTSNWDNACTEPEREAEGQCGSEGELDEELDFVIWADDGDNVMQDDENVIFEGTAKELEEQSTTEGVLLDGNPSSNVTEPFSNEETGYIGVKYEIPLETGNRIQGDSLTYDISFYTEQRRHNEDPENPWESENSEEKPENESLEASFVRANDRPLSTMEGNEVRLYSNSTGDSDSNHRWNMGDGTTLYGQDVLHTWNSSGNYSVTLTLTEPNGETMMAEKTIEVVTNDTVEDSGPSGNLTFNDQTTDNGSLTINNVSTEAGSTVYVTYEDSNETILAGVHNAPSGLDNFDPMTVDINKSGVPGEYTARMIEKPVAIGYNSGDVVQDSTLQKEYFSQSAQISAP